MNKKRNDNELITLLKDFVKLFNQIKVLLFLILLLLIFILCVIAFCFGSVFEMFVCCVFVVFSVSVFDFLISKV